ncbi:MAG: response regulator [Vicinamibacterales bacterium]
MAHTLLLADDSLTIQRVVELTFAGQDVKVVAVRDGQQAIDKLAEIRPDIVLADIAMPKVDGYEVAAFVARTPSLACMPVLLLSGAFEPVDDARVKASGAAGVLVKPFEPSLVISRVKELLGLAARDPHPASGRLVTAPGGPPHAPRTPERQAPAARAPEHATPAPPPVTPAPADAAWETLRAESGLGPDPVESQAAANAEDLDLDAAFDTLDAKLAGRTTPRGRATHAPPAPRLPAALDPARHQRREPEPVDHRPPVFEVSGDWFDTPLSPGAAAEAETADRFDGLVEDPFDGDLAHEFGAPGPAAAAPAPSPDAAAPPASAPPAAAAGVSPDAAGPAPAAPAPWAPAPVRPEPPAEPPAAVVPPESPSTSPAPAPASAAEAPAADPAVSWGATYAGPPPQVADAFAALLADEQGEPPPASAPAQAMASTDDLVRAVAGEVAGRIDEQRLASAIRAAVAGDVERVLRETDAGLAGETV